MEEIKRLVYSRELRWNEILVIAMRLFREKIKVVDAGHWSAHQYFADTDSKQSIESNGVCGAGVIEWYGTIAPRIYQFDTADDDE